jgi:oligopeptide transport system permease protein
VGAIAGNFGLTYASRGARRVQEEFFEPRGKALLLLGAAGRTGAALGCVTGVPLGVLAALKQNSWIDYLVLLLSTTFVALGTLVTGYLLIIIFAVGSGWFIVISDWDEPNTLWILPTAFFGKAFNGLLLIFTAVAIIGWTDMARLVRGQVLSLKEKEFIEAALLWPVIAISLLVLACTFVGDDLRDALDPRGN